MPQVSTNIWQKRIEAARKRRDLYVTRWQEFCRLHTTAQCYFSTSEEYRHLFSLSDSDTVFLGLVFRNIEQTLGYLEMDDIGVTARATNYDRPLDNVDTNNESVVEQALYESLKKSGLISGTERLDRIKLDALLCGHGIAFSYWNMLEEEVETDRVPVFTDNNGLLEPKTDKNGNQKFVVEKAKETIWEGVVDERISPLEFLCSSTANSIDESHWLGFERIIRIADLQQDQRYSNLPKLKGGTFTIKTLSGDTARDDTTVFMEDSVKVITLWDRITRKLITFIDSNEAKNQKEKEPETFIKLRELHFPVKFDNPQDSPFSVFIPIPATDQPFGISQVDHIKNPAVEGDAMRSRFANLSRNQKRLWVYNNNSMDQDQIDTVINGKESLAALGLKLEEGVDLSRVIKDIQTVNIPDSLLTAATLSEDTVRKNSGVSETPFGGTETATESENQMMIGQARVNRKRNKLFNFLEQVTQTHLAYLRRFAPEGSTLRVILADGTDALMTYGRESFQGRFHIKVQPGGGASAISPVRQKMLIEAVGMVGQNMGPKASLLLFREVLTQMDIRNVNGILQAAKEFMIPQQPTAEPSAMNPQQQSIPNPETAINPHVLGNAVNVTR
ncbi:hypothetical protein CI610_01372 [invertebrate metagenome]|uniref:Portal protein n=1 Tax=invertebrate metagenome TaxID=1711999 RepID=A0A2H9T944_9ZZZZ